MATSAAARRRAGRPVTREPDRQRLTHRCLTPLGPSAGGRARESLQLAQTRDALLPLLMSGKVRVKDAEKIVEGVV